MRLIKQHQRPPFLFITFIITSLPPFLYITALTVTHREWTANGVMG